MNLYIKIYIIYIDGWWIGEGKIGILRFVWTRGDVYYTIYVQSTHSVR